MVQRVVGRVMSFCTINSVLCTNSANWYEFRLLTQTLEKESGFLQGLQRKEHQAVPAEFEIIILSAVRPSTDVAGTEDSYMFPGSSVIVTGVNDSMEMLNDLLRHPCISPCHKKSPKYSWSREIRRLQNWRA